MIKKEDIRKAKSVNLLKFLQKNYPDEIFYDKKSHCYRNKVHDSMVVNKNVWYRFSTCEGGDSIEYLVQFLHFSFNDAIKTLNEFIDSVEDEESPSETEIFYKPYEKENSEGEIYKYMRKRGISDDITKKLIENKLLYMDIFNNIVFSNENENNEIYVRKGTGSLRFNQILSKYKFGYWKFKVGSGNILFICESPIDAISLYECNGRCSGVYAAMCGLKTETLKRIIKEIDPDREMIVKIGVDWDAAGLKFVKKNDLERQYIVLDSGKYAENTKDWNDVLLKIKKERKSDSIKHQE